MPEILIETGLFNYEEEEFQELVRELQQLGPEYEVRRVYTHWPHKEKAAGGFPVIEALDIWIPWGHIAGGAAAAATQVIVQRSLEWLREQKWKGGAGPPEVHPLPKRVNIYGPRGEILQVVEVERPYAEPTNKEIENPEEQKRDRSTLREWPLEHPENQS